MSTVIYSVYSRDTLFNGYCDQEDMRFDADYWYENTDREKSLEIARKYSDDSVIAVDRHGISRDVYEWNALEYEDDVIVGAEIKIFDPLDRFKQLKTFATSAYKCECDLISYIVGERELIWECMHNDHWLNVYRYEGTVFGDFTAYEEEKGNLWLPKTFYDYGVNPNELIFEIDDSKFWQDWQTTDPEARLLYKIFQNN